MDKLELTQDEIYRLKQSVCDHEPDDNSKSEPNKCYCCGGIHHAICEHCGVGFEKDPECHDPEDPDYPYCVSCN